jgi:hypothetical protein
MRVSTVASTPGSAGHGMQRHPIGLRASDAQLSLGTWCELTIIAIGAITSRHVVNWQKESMRRTCRLSLPLSPGSRQVQYSSFVGRVGRASRAHASYKFCLRTLLSSKVQRMNTSRFPPGKMQVQSNRRQGGLAGILSQPHS